MAQPQPQLTHSSRPTALRFPSPPKAEEGEKCKAMTKSPPWPRANTRVSHSGHGEGELGRERI